ncbi:response regulator [Paraburkholderia antibiotica]|uniref:Response regulator transcription factor n=1 Tax=Paraburkholderia antibiotica TaxID=2728839 RepID=A0A7Y0FFL6_9BURK|nr:response regulator [Paraburkholderia antibiotica]NML34220.1 response regulator transcription factor [Paraburkholderia antibiotica]
MNVAVADMHPAVLAGVGVVLSEFERFDIAGTARNSTELDALLSTMQCDVLVIDHLARIDSDLEGVTLLADLHRRYPALPIVLFTTDDDPNLSSKTSRLGVCSIVQKSDEIGRLIEAVGDAAQTIIALRRPSDVFCMH